MDLYFFNPGCEIEVAANKAVYSLPKYPAMLEHDLSVLPMCFAQKGDCVLISKTDDVDFRDYWSERFQCEFVDIDDSRFSVREFDFYRPWGISPRALRLGEKYRFSAAYYNSPVGRWMPEHRLLFSRATSVDFFEEMSRQDGYDVGLLPQKNQLPCIAKTMDEAAAFLRDRRDGAVFKAIYGSSGRGVRILKNSQMTPNLDNWLRSIIKTQGAVECEHLFEKIVDFSCHYDIEDGKAKFVGVSTFSTSDTGAYIGSRVGRCAGIPRMEQLAVEKITNLHIAALNNSAYTKYYCGPLGIDCMVYREGGALKIDPCIEINCRHSMGRLAMMIEDLVGCEAEFVVFPKNTKPSVAAQEPVFSNGKLVGGYMSLTPKDTMMFSAGVYCL